MTLDRLRHALRAPLSPPVPGRRPGADRNSVLTGYTETSGSSARSGICRSVLVWYSA